MDIDALRRKLPILGGRMLAGTVRDGRLRITVAFDRLDVALEFAANMRRAYGPACDLYEGRTEDRMYCIELAIPAGPQAGGEAALGRRSSDAAALEA